MSDAASWLPLVTRTLVVGVFGGAGLVLTHLYTRRGPMIYPVYAAILLALGLVSARFSWLPYLAHLVGNLVAMFTASAILLVAVIHRSNIERARLRAAGRTLVPGGAPWWGFPSIFFAIVAASAGVAYLSS